MKNCLTTLSLVLLAALFSSCNEVKIKTAEDIVNASIKFHDPSNKWQSLNADFIFESKFDFNDSVPEELHIKIDVPNNSFQYTNSDREVSISYNKDSCQVIHGNATCDGYQWTKNFYTYIWGLPMKLKDPQTVIKPKFKLDTIQKIPLYTVYVPYENENFKFYFDQKTFELKFFEFLKNSIEKKGEFISLSEVYDYKGIKFPKHRKWANLFGGELIGTNEVMSITANQ